MPLFNKEVKIKAIYIGDGDIKVAIDKTGKSNWSTLFKKTEATQLKKPVKVNRVSARPQVRSYPSPLPANHIYMQSGLLVIKTPDSTLRFENLAFALKDIEPDSLARFSATALAKLTFLDSNSDVEGLVELDSGITLDPSLTEVDFYQTQLRMLLNDLSEEALTGTIQTQGSYNFDTSTLKMDPINAQVNLAKFIFAMTIDNLKSSPDFSIKIPQQRAYFGRVFKSFIPESPSREYQLDILDSLEVGGHIIYAKGSLGIFLSPFMINAHPGSIKFVINKDLSMLLDANLSFLDLRPLLDPAETATISEAKVISKFKKPDNTDHFVPKALLKNLKSTATIRVNQLVHPNFELKNLFINASSEQGVIDVNPVTMDIFDGGSTLQFKLDTTLKTPKLSLFQTAEEIEIGEAFKELTDQRWINGLIDNRLELVSQGDSLEELFSNAEGMLDLKMKSGFIPGVSLSDIALSSAQRFKTHFTALDLVQMDKKRQKLPTGTTIEQFFASFKVTPKEVSTKRALASINGEPANTKIMYSRMDKTLEFTSEMGLNLTDPVLQNLTWPVSCRIKDWKLPRCGVPPAAVEERLTRLKNASFDTIIDETINKNSTSPTK